jgi:transposase
VTTTCATQTDMEALDSVHLTLAQHDLLPAEHLLDAGYVDAEALASASRDLGVEICSPVRSKVSWLAKAAEGFDLAQFRIDWDTHEVTGRPRLARPLFKCVFHRRSVGVVPVQRNVLKRGTVRGFELRRTRYIGSAKTHWQMVATPVAINLPRLFDWWEEKPRARTRTSPFARLAPDSSQLLLGWRAG